MVKHLAGLVTLVVEDNQLIEPDINVIRALERDGVFDVEDELRA